MTRFSKRGFLKRVRLSAALLAVSWCVGCTLTIWNLFNPNRSCPANPKIFDANPKIFNTPLQFPVDPNEFEPISATNADRLMQLAVVKHVPDGDNGRGVRGGSITFSPDSTVLAIQGTQDVDGSAGPDEICGSVWLWHLSSPQSRLDILKTSRDGDSDYEVFVAFSPHSQMLLTNRCAYGRSTKDCYDLWDVTTGRLIRTFGYAEFVHFPDRDVVSFHDMNAFGRRLWDIARRHEVFDVPRDSAISSARLFSPDNKLFISTSADAVISVYQTDTQQKVAELRGHADQEGIDNIDNLMFSADGKWLVSQGSDTRVWDVHTGQQHLLLDVARNDFYGRGPDFDFSLDSHVFRLKTDFWNVENETLIERLPMNASTRMFLGLNVDKTVYNTGSKARWDMDFVAGWGGGFQQVNPINSIEILNAKTGAALSLRAVNGNVPSLTFSPDGRFIAILVDKSWTYGYESHLELWGIPRGK